MQQSVVQAIKWGVKAVGGLIANLALLTVWVDYLGIHPAIAILPNFVLVSLAGYTVANHWIFPDGVTPTTWRGHATQYAGMQAAVLTSKAANFALYLLLLPFVEYRLAWVAGAIVTFALTFGLNKAWWEREDSAIPQRP